MGFKLKNDADGTGDNRNVSIATTCMSPLYASLFSAVVIWKHCSFLQFTQLLAAGH